MIPLEKIIITQQMIDAAADALANEDLLFGESVKLFEEEFAAYCGADHAISVASGTDALLFSLLAIGVKDQHVLTTPISYVATANVAYLARGKPVFCDIGEDNNIDPEQIKKTLKRDKKIKAIIPVHLHGYPAKMDEIMEAAGDIPVIEDAAQAHGALYYENRVGTIGKLGCFSFNPFKNMTVGGSGGMVVTNDEALAKKVRMIADSGRESIYTHEHKIIGYSSRINSVNAAIGRVQLQHIESWNEQRREAARHYNKILKEFDEILLPPAETADIKPVFNKYAIKLKNRDIVKEQLFGSGIDCDAHYPIPIHHQPPYKDRNEKYPVAEKFADSTLSLPIFPGITKKEIEEVAKTLRYCLQDNQVI
ncbi:DegT/DnrJ/EryC1/StrS family aminotransferase [Candidatus Micrarchaeota archaeon]|nr:DegT/DnrJ/EryC1/StrS family aminotransferase [Candidatus Micrarchaeota archaeon]MBU1681286.1 DegT/DnrJ/EryC1/StrS family aminotransferase [Candidatus Micrarchaeota archaeon]